jgi:hypothetical protein
MRILDRKLTIRFADHDLQWLKTQVTETSPSLSKVVRHILSSYRVRRGI